MCCSVTKELVYKSSRECQYRSFAHSKFTCWASNIRIDITFLPIFYDTASEVISDILRTVSIYKEFVLIKRKSSLATRKPVFEVFFNEVRHKLARSATHFIKEALHFEIF